MAALAGVLLLGGCGGDGGDGGGSSSGGGALSLLAGFNDQQDPNIAVTELLPESVTVAAGTTVEWRFPGPQPHSVTFFPAGQQPPAPGSDQSLFAPKPPTGPYDGKTLVNSGVLPAGPGPATPFRVTFSTPGQYGYSCVIHPRMTGKVTVVDSGGEADTQQEVNARADEELARWLEEGRAAKRKLTQAAPAMTRDAGGTTTWRLGTGATTEHTDVLAFSPTDAEIRPGDLAVFVNGSGAPHTATFAGGQQLPLDPTSPEAERPAPGPSPQTLRPTGLFNTGVLPPDAPPGGAPPEPARSFTFVVPAAGTYTYVCLIHVSSGMTGTIKVA